MAATTLDLFRAGNKSGARLHLTWNADVQTQHVNGCEVVIAGSGGASTLDAIGQLRGTWWKLPAGAVYDDSKLLLRNDFIGHWAWEPASTMPLADYLAALAIVNQEFILA